MSRTPSELVPLPYHVALVAHLRRHEPALWEWFSSTRFLEEHASEVRLELLRSAYRLDEEAHPELHARARTVLERLGLDAGVTFYQAHGATQPNAALRFLPGEAHLVLVGNVTSQLEEDELTALIAHELAHFVLWSRWDGQYRVADQLLRAMASHPEAAPAHGRSWRLFHLYTELFADRGALAAGAAPETAIATLLKVETGLKTVSAKAYLGQVGEILEKGAAGSSGVSHPELHLRAKALALWAERGADAEDEVARLIEGPRTIDELDLVAQARVTELTRGLIAQVLRPACMRTDALLAHARLFFPDFAAGEGADESPDRSVASRASLEGIEEYIAYVLLDFAAADPGLEEVALAAAFGVAERLEVADRFHEAARRELGLKVKDLKRVREGAAGILEAAGREVAE